MGNLDARVGHLEGRMLEQSEGVADVRESVARLDDKMSRQSSGRLACWLPLPGPSGQLPTPKPKAKPARICGLVGA